MTPKNPLNYNQRENIDNLFGNIEGLKDLDISKPMSPVQLKRRVTYVRPLDGVKEQPMGVLNPM